MLKLIHFRLCPLSRSIRLALAERDLAFELEEERAWEWRAGFLALNPAGVVPTLVSDGVAETGDAAILLQRVAGDFDILSRRLQGSDRLVGDEKRVADALVAPIALRATAA